MKCVMFLLWVGCIMSSFMICSLCHMFLGYSNQGGWGGQSREMHTGLQLENLR
jgi:hypothetical protein